MLSFERVVILTSITRFKSMSNRYLIPSVSDTTNRQCYSMVPAECLFHVCQVCAHSCISKLDEEQGDECCSVRVYVGYIYRCLTFHG